MIPAVFGAAGAGFEPCRPSDPAAGVQRGPHAANEVLHGQLESRPRGWLVVDVWESADKFNEFGQTLMPILAKNGVQEVEPVVLPLHYMYSGKLVH